MDDDQFVQFLAFIDAKGGATTMDEFSRALPAVEFPISAVFDLSDIGIVRIDFSVAFDGEMGIWLIGG